MRYSQKSVLAHPDTLDRVNSLQSTKVHSYPEDVGLPHQKRGDAEYDDQKSTPNTQISARHPPEMNQIHQQHGHGRPDIGVKQTGEEKQYGESCDVDGRVVGEEGYQGWFRDYHESAHTTVLLVLTAPDDSDRPGSPLDVLPAEEGQVVDEEDAHEVDVPETRGCAHCVT